MKRSDKHSEKTQILVAEVQNGMTCIIFRNLWKCGNLLRFGVGMVSVNWYELKCQEQVFILILQGDLGQVDHVTTPCDTDLPAYSDTSNSDTVRTKEPFADSRGCHFKRAGLYVLSF